MKVGGGREKKEVKCYLEHVLEYNPNNKKFKTADETVWDEFCENKTKKSLWLKRIQFRYKRMIVQ